MSVLVINGESVAVTFEPGLAVGEIVGDHMDGVIPAGEIVCQVQVDGADEQIERLRWGEFDQLTVLTAHPTDLVIDGLGSSGDIFDITFGLNAYYAKHNLKTQLNFTLRDSDTDGPTSVDAFITELMFTARVSAGSRARVAGGAAARGSRPALPAGPFWPRGQIEP